MAAWGLGGVGLGLPLGPGKWVDRALVACIGKLVTESEEEGWEGLFGLS